MNKDHLHIIPSEGKEARQAFSPVALKEGLNVDRGFWCSPDTFVHVSRLTSFVGKAVVRREVALLKKRVLDVRERIRERSAKRRKLTLDGNASADAPTNDLEERRAVANASDSKETMEDIVSREEQDHLRSQTARIERMLELLDSLKATQRELYQEMMNCETIKKKS
jgi:hypothetical protein